MSKGFSYSRAAVPGGAGPGGADIRGPTFVVGANDSQHPNAADYTCDGVADEVQINAALNALPAGGGRVVLLDGTYVLADPIIIPDDAVTLEGQGYSTLINGDGLATGEHAIIIDGHEEVTIRNLSVQTEDGAGKICHCINISNGANRFLIEHVTVLESDDDGIHIEGTSISGGTIHQCRVEGADGAGICVDMTANDRIVNLVISECMIASCLNGIELNTSTDCERYTIVDNEITSCVNNGILATDVPFSIISNNKVQACGWDGISITLTVRIEVHGNIVFDCVRNGIELTTVQSSSIADNILFNNDANDSSNYHGIALYDSDHNDVVDNVCRSNGGYGIYTDNSPYCNIVGNYSTNNELDGIVHSGAYSNVTANYCLDNGHHAQGASHGIVLTQYSDNSLVSGNWCGNPDQERYQEDGIHVQSGAYYVSIEGNYCFYGLGSGIALAGDNDFCQIHGNFCYDNDDYGVEIAATTTMANVKDNYLFLNDAGQISDAGTDTAVHEVWAQATTDTAADLALIGYRPVVELDNGQDDYAYCVVQVPLDFKEFVSVHFVIVPGGTGDMVWTVDTSFGKICADEQQDTHTDTTGATITPVTNDELECLGIANAFTDIARGDNIGIRLFREGTSQDDTVNASVYAVGVRLRYV